MIFPRKLNQLKKLEILIFLIITHSFIHSQDYLDWAEKVAESVMMRNPDVYNNGNWDYVTGTILRGFQELWYETGKEKYFDYIKNTVDFSVRNDGSIAGYNIKKYNLDEINEGRIVLFLYEETGDSRYKKAADSLRKQLEEQPRTSDGGFWHKERYPYQMWLDGLYMASPFYAYYGKLFNEPENFDDVVLQLSLMEKHARDTETGLLYHGWNETKEQDWANDVTGCSSEFWGRAIGWYSMALVDVLDYLPVDYTLRDSVIHIFQRLSIALKNFQDDSIGVWWQVVDKAGWEGNYPEASASCMFVYSLAKGIRLGYIDKKKFLPVVKKGFEGILKEFVVENQDGSITLTKICKTAGLGGYGRDGSYEYYVSKTDIVDNDGKGIGPFITGCIELARLFNSESIDKKRNIPGEFKLNIYPNPFNSVAEISLSIPEDKYISLDLYDILGRKVQTLLSGSKRMGKYEFVFKDQGLSTGVYFCLLKSGNSRIVKKITLLK